MNLKSKVLAFLFVLTSVAVFAQTKTITGTVKDDQGAPLPGVTVVLEGTTQGTITDLDGKYSISAQPTDQLKFSFVGFKDQLITVGEQTTIDVTLLPDVESIDEVVVVGYGVQKKESVVGSIATTNSEDLKQQGNITNLTDALSGSMPGVTVLSSTGVPGGGGDGGGDFNASEILIRGKATWNNSGPLILVDGIERNMNDIDINEVESISVLKDASATAVFGMKGGNGVILITTKRGKTGKAKLSFEAQSSWETVSKMPEVLDAYTGLQARNYAILGELPITNANWNTYYVPDEILGYYRDQTYPEAYPSQDYTDLMSKDWATSYRVNMNVSGGTEFVKYFSSLSYSHTGDILNTEDVGQGYNPEFSYNRFNFRSNLDFNLTKTTQLSANIGGYYGIQQKSGGSYHSIYYGLYNHSPSSPVLQYSDGTYGMPYSTTDYERVSENEYVELNFNGVDRTNRTEVNSDFKLKQDLDFFVKGLSINAKLAYDNYFLTSGPNINDDGVLLKHVDPEYYLSDDPDKDINDYTNYNPASGTFGFEWVEAPISHTTQNFSNNNAEKTKRALYYEASMNYARAFGKHDVSALFLFSRNETVEGSEFDSKREDWVGRFTYNYDKRYLFEVNGAYNGSEFFGPGYKFDFFPSIALGWTLSNEAFMKDNAAFINMLKLRYSNGMVGNDRAVGVDRWAYVTTWNNDDRFTDENRDPVPFGNLFLSTPYERYREGIPGNPKLRWEKANKQNYGVEFGFFKNVISGTFDYFKEHRFDMIVAAVDRNVHSTYGQTPPAANFGEVDSWGWEAVVTLKKVHPNSLNYYATGTYTRAKNEIVKKDDPEMLPDYRKSEGYAIDQRTMNVSSEIINSWDDVYTGVLNYSDNTHYMPGDPRYIDYNSDGVIGPEDIIPFGYALYPQNTFSISFGGGFKGINVTVQFYGHNNVTREVKINPFAFKSDIVFQEDIDNTWTPEYGNDNPTRHALTFSKTDYTDDADYYYRDASLLRLRMAEISYTLPSELTKRINISQMKFFVNGNNIYVWSDMPVDGEGQDFQVKNYPVKKQFTAGVNIQF